MNKIEIGLIKFKNQLNKAFPSGKTNYYASGIITAAGSGTRMGGVSKQLLEIHGMPCILYSLKAFQNCPEINEIIIVSKEEEHSKIQQICSDYNISKLSKIVPGGKTRQESVANGFSVISHKCELVAIHDAARPLIQSRHISTLLESTRRFGAACAAKKVVDTVKKADENLLIRNTVPRDDLFTVQTPQVFKADLYRVALALAQKNRITVTDDCALAENAGFPIKLCELGIHNVKLTTNDDLSLIEAILKERKDG